jgi:hypothetical protein
MMDKQSDSIRTAKEKGTDFAKNTFKVKLKGTPEQLRPWILLQTNAGE